MQHHMCVCCSLPTPHSGLASLLSWQAKADTWCNSLLIPHHALSMATKHKLLLRCSHYCCSCLPRYSHWQSFTECSGHLIVIVGTRYSYVIPISEVTEVTQSVWINRPLWWLQQGWKTLVDLHLQWGATSCNKDGDSAFIKPCHTYICPVSILN